MLSEEDYVYAAVVSHVSWQQIATGPVYRIPEFDERVTKATGVQLPASLLEYVIQRMAKQGLASLIDTGIAGTYFKINYKPVNEYVATRAADPGTAEFQYRIIGKRLLTDLLGEPEPESQVEETENSPPPILSEQSRIKLVSELEKASRDLDSQNVSNEVKAQAGAYLTAARSLAEAPEPPVNIIWDLIQRANALAGIASLFVAIIALFGH